MTTCAGSRVPRSWRGTSGRGPAHCLPSGSCADAVTRARVSVPSRGRSPGPSTRSRASSAIPGAWHARAISIPRSSMPGVLVTCGPHRRSPLTEEPATRTEELQLIRLLESAAPGRAVKRREVPSRSSAWGSMNSSLGGSPDVEVPIVADRIVLVATGVAVVGARVSVGSDILLAVWSNAREHVPIVSRHHHLRPHTLDPSWLSRCRSTRCVGRKGRHLQLEPDGRGVAVRRPERGGALTPARSPVPEPSSTVSVPTATLAIEGPDRATGECPGSLTKRPSTCCSPT